MRKSKLFTSKNNMKCAQFSIGVLVIGAFLFTMLHKLSPSPYTQISAKKKSGTCGCKS